jgi:hypothetical protein
MCYFIGLKNFQKPFLQIPHLILKYRGLGHLNAFLSSTCSIIYGLKNFNYAFLRA